MPTPLDPVNDQKVALSEVASVASPQATDLFFIGRSGVGKLVAWADMLEAIDDRVATSLLVAGSNVTLTYDDSAGTLTIASSGGGTWGSITGTLSAQTDLQSALDAKASASHTHAASAITSGTLDAARIPDLSATYSVTSHTHTGVYQPLDADLTALAGLTPARGDVLYYGASGWAVLSPGTDGYQLTTHGAGADPTWAAGGGGGVSDGDKGDVTVSGSGATWTIDSGVVTYAKMQDVSATDKVLGRSTAGAGDVEEIPCTAAGRALLDDADAAAQRTTLGVRQTLTANTTYYVSDSTGSDTTGDGSSGAPWKTIQKAIDYVAGLDCRTYDVTVSVASGTYAPIDLKSFLGSGTVTILGDVTTPTNVVISSTSGVAVNGSSVAGRYTLAGLKIATSGGGTHGIYLFGASCHVTVDRCRFSACASSHMVVLSGAALFALDYSIDGSCGAASYHAYAAGGSFRCDSKTVTITGTPAFGNGTSGAFAACDRNGVYYSPGCTFSGSATGRRHYVYSSGVVMTGGAGSSYFPGNAAGVVDTATYGVYV